MDSHPMAIYKRQAGNGVPTRMTEVALALGLLGHDYEGAISKPRAVGDSSDLSWCKELPLTVARPEKDGAELSIRPIRASGTVCDHMLPYTDATLCRMLEVKARRCVRAGKCARPADACAYDQNMEHIK